LAFTILKGRSEVRAWIMGCLAIAIGATSLAAADYPRHPITLVVPYTAGGPADAVGRLIATHMGSSLGQQFVIENVVGAGGTIGAGRVAKAAPDGYTLLIHNLGLPAASAFCKTLPYDTRSAFEPLGLVNTGPMVLVSKKGLAADTPGELWAILKSKPRGLTLAWGPIRTCVGYCYREPSAPRSPLWLIAAQVRP
jgi:tripartite-type tricarboxylate transporter receptor subunit TctC